MTGIEPRPAATIVVVRSGAAAPIEVLLVRRNDKVAFMAGAYVFPGGRVDDDDRAMAERMHAPAGLSRFPDLSSKDELPFRVAAVRELQEEANVTVDAADLVAIAHWVTPDIESRRYDTRFYLARMPPGQIARHDEGEMTELEWVPPLAAVARCESGTIMLPPPTWTTLKQIGRFDTVEALFDWAGSKPIARVQPGFIRNGAATLLTLPGDPLHPTVEGWEIPEDTRFVLEEGKGWRPARA